MIRGTITYKGMDAIKPAELRKAVKKELQTTVEYWHENMLPQHFARGAKQKYGYKDRKEKYNKIKKRRLHHTKPLVYTGQLERMVKRKARISGTSKRATVAMDAPRYMYQYKPDQPNKAAELTAVTAPEANTLAQVLDKQLEKQLNKG